MYLLPITKLSNKHDSWLYLHNIIISLISLLLSMLAMTATKFPRQMLPNLAKTKILHNASKH